MTDHIPNTMMNINEIIDGNSIVIMYEQRQTERDRESEQTDRQSESHSRQTGRWEDQSSTSCSLSDFQFSFFVRFLVFF